MITVLYAIAIHMYESRIHKYIATRTFLSHRDVCTYAQQLQHREELELEGGGVAEAPTGATARGDGEEWTSGSAPNSNGSTVVAIALVFTS